jgi:hypothetical protein
VQGRNLLFQRRRVSLFCPRLLSPVRSFVREEHHIAPHFGSIGLGLPLPFERLSFFTLSFALGELGKDFLQLVVLISAEISQIAMACHPWRWARDDRFQSRQIGVLEHKGGNGVNLGG